MRRAALVRTALLGAALAAAALVGTRAGAAWTVASGFSEPCHERLTAGLYEDYLAGLVPAGLALPEGDAWRRITDALLQSEERVPEDPVERYALTSLLVGVRHPDTGGHGLDDLRSVRRRHLEAEAQADHALRAPGHDGPEGDRQAVEAARAHVRDLAAWAEAALAKPVSEQIVETYVVLDHYGRVPVAVWEPAFLLGQAAHTVQDSFSHTVRSDDLRRIRHVLNYVDAISTNHRESRDGVPHSDAMDRCESNTAIAAAARQATQDWFLAIRDRLSGHDPGAVTAFLDAWLAYEPGCYIPDEGCASRWLPIVRSAPTQPVLGCAAAGAAAGGRGAPGPGALWSLLLGLCGLTAARAIGRHGVQ